MINKKSTLSENSVLFLFDDKKIYGFFMLEFFSIISSFFISSFFIFELEFIIGLFMLPFIVEFDGLIAGLIVAIGDAVLAGIVVFIGLFILELLAVLTFTSVLGQAAPNNPNVKTAERAITFFISINSPVFFKENTLT